MSRQHEVAMIEVTADRLSSADQTKIKLVDCALQVVVRTANKSVNTHQFERDGKKCRCKDSNGRRYRTKQDEVIEVTIEEQLKTRLASYINEFMRVSNTKRKLF